MSLAPLVKLLGGQVAGQLRELSTWLWNGMRLVLWLPATSNLIQLAKNRSAPASRIARPFVQLTRYSPR